MTLCFPDLSMRDLVYMQSDPDDTPDRQLPTKRCFDGDLWDVILRVTLSTIVVTGLIASWIPAVALGYFWVRWFVFFTSIEDYGLNDFSTVFQVAVGVVLTGATIFVGLLTAALNAVVFWRLKSTGASTRTG